jgi:CHAD domain-containing protein
VANASVFPIRVDLLTIPDAGPREVRASQTLGEAALVVLRRHIGTLLELEPAVRVGDADAIHDARVSIRRARTAFRLFRDALPDRAQPLHAELGWIAARLGDVRDLDVMRTLIQGQAKESSDEEHASLDVVDVILAERRTRALRALIEALDSHRFGALRYGLLHVVRGGGAGGPAARVPLVEVAPRLVRKRYRAVRRAGDHLGDDAPSAAIHALRIHAKRLRYTVEFFTAVYGSPARRLARRVEALQELIGDLRDAEIAIEALRALSSEVDVDGRSRFALGRIAERERRRALKLRRRFPDAFARITGRRWKELKSEMQTAG